MASLLSRDEDTFDIFLFKDTAGLISVLQLLLGPWVGAAGVD